MRPLVQLPLTLPTVPAYTVASWQRLRWHKDTRYYEAYLHQDLWGRWLLTRTWGRRESNLGQTRHTPCRSQQHGLELLQATIKRREKRGYRLVKL